MKRGTDTKSGRAAIAEIMKKSTSPFAVITEPTGYTPTRAKPAFNEKNKSVYHDKTQHVV